METSQKNTIPVVILCGGMGTRLKEETEFKPKPMVEIGGRPILWHIMKIYAHYGFYDFVLALGYKGDSIRDYFLKHRYYESDFAVETGGLRKIEFLSNGKLEQDNFRIIFAETGLETPHGERVLILQKYLKDSDLFMVTYGDGVADINIETLVAFHKAHGKIATITGVHPISRWGLVNANEDGTVTTLDQKPMLYDYVNGGFMVFDKRFFEFLKPGDMIEDSLARLIPQQQLALFKHEGFWYGMDTYRDFLVLNELWAKDPKWKVWK